MHSLWLKLAPLPCAVLQVIDFSGFKHLGDLEILTGYIIYGIYLFNLFLYFIDISRVGLYVKAKVHWNSCQGHISWGFCLVHLVDGLLRKGSTERGWSLAADLFENWGRPKLLVKSSVSLLKWPFGGMYSAFRQHRNFLVSPTGTSRNHVFLPCLGSRLRGGLYNFVFGGLDECKWFTFVGSCFFALNMLWKTEMENDPSWQSPAGPLCMASWSVCK